MMSHDGCGIGICTANVKLLDAVGDRDFALEFLSVASICAMHLSRFAEGGYLVLGPIPLCDIVRSLLTGSSIMPQRKTPMRPN